jgi:ATP/maltotriose-dependent transcriptional regulator MalT/DNA-binding SARP family transcriptional activator
MPERDNAGESPELGFITKILAPRSRSGLIERPRLLTTLDESADAEATAILAPAGYGKTTLLLQYLARRGSPVCWLTLDAYDAEPAHLLRYLILTLDQHLTGLARALLPAMSAGDDSVRGLRESLSHLVTTVHLRAPEPFLLVLDDIHVLDGSAAAREILEPLLKHLPRACRLLIAGRKLPDLPVIHRLRAGGQLELVDRVDLTFTAEEAHQLLLRRCDGSLTSEDEAVLFQQSEGWAAGLVMLAQRARRQRGAAPSPARELFGYLCGEAFEELPDDRKQLLLLASVPRRVTGELLHGLSESAADELDEGLELLQREELFIQRIDGPQPAYRFHQLYRDFLQDRLRRSGLSPYRTLHSRAAGLLSAAGEWQEAVYHCAEAEDWEQAAAILEHAVPAVTRTGQWHGLATAMDLLPDCVRDERPQLALLRAQAWIRLGDLPRASALLDRVGPRLTQSGASLHAARWRLLHGATLRGSGKLSDAEQQFSLAVRILLEIDAPASIVADARRQLGTCAGMLGDFERARAELEASLLVFDGAHDRVSAASVHDALGICLNRLGQPEAALAQYRAACRTWRELGNLSGLALSLVNASTLHHEQGDHHHARSLLTEALRAARDAGNQRLEIYALLGLGDVALAVGDDGAARERFAIALERSTALGESFALTYACCGSAESRRRLGALEQGEAELQSRLAELGHSGTRMERALCRLHLGLIERDRRDYPAAVCSLSEAAGMFAHQHARREEARASFLLASVQFDQRRRRPAIALLERVAEIVENLGSEQCILAEASSAPLLIQYAAAHRAGNGLYSRLVHRLMERPSEETECSATGAGARYPRIVVRALAPLEVTVGDRRVSDLEWRSAASRELFLYLLTTGEHRKEEIATALWPELAPDRLNSQFHSTIYRVRQALFAESLLRKNGRYAVNPAVRVEYDVLDFERLLAEAETFARGSDQRAACIRDALRLYDGAFADEIWSDWARVVRDRLEDRYLQATASLAAYHAGRGEYEASITLCKRILFIDPQHEGATFELMRARVATGDAPEALRIYRRYSELLRDEGIGDPPAALTRLSHRLSAVLGAAVS